MTVEQPGAREQYADWKRWPETYRAPMQDDWAKSYDALLAENARLVGEVEDMRRSTVGDIFRRIAELTTRAADATVKVQECMAERDSLLAENARLRDDVAMGEVGCGQLEKALNIYGGHLSRCQVNEQMPMKIGRAYMMPTDAVDWQAKQPCTCGWSAIARAALTREST